MHDDLYKSQLDGVVGRVNESLLYGIDKLIGIQNELGAQLRDSYDELSRVVAAIDDGHDMAEHKKLRQRRDDLDRERIRSERLLSSANGAIGRLRLALELVNNRISSLDSITSFDDISDAVLSMQFTENEYKHLAREIHDGPIQQFAAIILMFDYLERVISLGDKDAIDRETSRIKRELKYALADFRGFLSHLQPSGLDIGLGIAISRFAEMARERYGVECRTIIASETDGLSIVMRTNILRVIQEATSNAVRHGCATEIEIAYMLGDESVSVTIEDNGTGFDPDNARERAKSRGSHGLANMAERIRFVGGELSIQSAEGSRTRIDINVPIGGDAK